MCSALRSAMIEIFEDVAAQNDAAFIQKALRVGSRTPADAVAFYTTPKASKPSEPKAKPRTYTLRTAAASVAAPLPAYQLCLPSPHPAVPQLLLPVPAVPAPLTVTTHVLDGMWEEAADPLVALSAALSDVFEPARSRDELMRKFRSAAAMPRMLHAAAPKLRAAVLARAFGAPRK
jgi:hypothetical protein